MKKIFTILSTIITLSAAAQETYQPVVRATRFKDDVKMDSSLIIGDTSAIEMQGNADTATIQSDSTLRITAPSVIIDNLVGADAGDQIHDSLEYHKVNTIIIASKIDGIHGDSDIDTGGGTDDTELLQAAIDTLSSRGRGLLLVDKVFLVHGLKHRSNVTIKGLGWNTGFYLKNESESSVIMNAHPCAGDTAIRDSNLVLMDIAINANGSNQSYDSTWGDWSHPNYYQIMGIKYLGIDNLIMDNVNIKNAASYSAIISNCPTTVKIRKFRAEGGTDCLHFWGPLKNLDIQGVQSNGADDVIALNFAENDNSGAEGNYISSGNLDHATVRDIFCDGTNSCVRVLGSSSYSFGDILLENFYGAKNLSSPYNAFYLNDSTSGNLLHVKGWKVKNVKLKFSDYADSHDWFYDIDNIMLEDIYGEHDDTLIIFSGNNCKNITIKNAVSIRSGPITKPQIYFRKGTYSNVSILGSTLNNADTTVKIAPGASITNLIMSGNNVSGKNALVSGAVSDTSGDNFISSSTTYIAGYGIAESSLGNDSIVVDTSTIASKEYVNTHSGGSTLVGGNDIRISNDSIHLRDTITVDIATIEAANITNLSVTGTTSIATTEATSPTKVLSKEAGSNAVKYSVLYSSGTFKTALETFDALCTANTIPSADLTDGTPTDAEIDAAVEHNPADLGDGAIRYVKDSTGTALMYKVMAYGATWICWGGSCNGTTLL